MANSVILSPMFNGVQVIFSGSGGSNSSLNSYDFQASLTSGVNNQWISYPIALTLLPTTVNCFLQNNIDNYTYIYSSSNITTSGFQINFSDYLKASGYILSIEMNA